MRKVPAMLVFVFTAAVLLTTSLLGFAQGIGTVTQVVLENFVYVYLEVFREVIILQLGDRKEAFMVQFGA